MHYSKNHIKQITMVRFTVKELEQMLELDNDHHIFDIRWLGGDNPIMALDIQITGPSCREVREGCVIAKESLESFKHHIKEVALYNAQKENGE